MNRPVPSPTNISLPFWNACKEHRLTLQKCGNCGQHTFFPAYVCPHCFADALQWVPASGKGTVYSTTVVERGAGPAFEEESPFTVALIELDEGPIMMSNIVGAEPYATRIGDRVEVDFRQVAEDTVLPVFRPAAKDKA